MISVGVPFISPFPKLHEFSKIYFTKVFSNSHYRQRYHSQLFIHSHLVVTASNFDYFAEYL